jgi:hypothetical protein
MPPRRARTLRKHLTRLAADVTGLRPSTVKKVGEALAAFAATVAAARMQHSAVPVASPARPPPARNAPTHGGVFLADAIVNPDGTTIELR